MLEKTLSFLRLRREARDSTLLQGIQPLKGVPADTDHGDLHSAKLPIRSAEASGIFLAMFSNFLQQTQRISPHNYSAYIDGGQMADTRVQLEVEDWVRRNWMAEQYGMSFSRERLRLRSGGVFDFDAVSADHSVVATISTSGSKTSGGKNAVGKMLKLRSDMLFLTMVEAKRRIVVLTERDMCDQCEREMQGAGAFLQKLSLCAAIIPDER